MKKKVPKFAKDQICVTKGTRFLPEGTRVKIRAGGDDAHGEMWSVRILSSEPHFQGLAGLWLVREDCLVPATD
jgi:hypothetical protein